LELTVKADLTVKASADFGAQSTTNVLSAPFPFVALGIDIRGRDM